MFAREKHRRPEAKFRMPVSRVLNSMNFMTFRCPPAGGRSKVNRFSRP
jgi:hypothetical protein